MSTFKHQKNNIFVPGDVMPKTSVYDAETGKKFNNVMLVDTYYNEIMLLHHPLRVIGEYVTTYTVRYKSIHAIYGDYPMPCLFICYGILNDY